MERYLLISDAAKEVQVESHVLRYWEEELHLPIRRNEMGHRYYTEEDVERFKQIKSMKEGGLQLKAIKMILKDGKIDVMMPEDEKAAIVKQEQNTEAAQEETQDGARSTSHENAKDGARGGSHENVQERAQSVGMAIQIIGSKNVPSQPEETKEEKARRLQWLMQQLIRETLHENNKELCREIKESVVKELDYQFRVQEEREEERSIAREKREEEHYQKLDELLRRKTRGGKRDTDLTGKSRRETKREKKAEQKVAGQKNAEQKNAKDDEEKAESKLVQQIEQKIAQGERQSAEQKTDIKADRKSRRKLFHKREN